MWNHFISQPFELLYELENGTVIPFHEFSGTQMSLFKVAALSVCASGSIHIGVVNHNLWSHVCLGLILSHILTMEPGAR